MKNTIKDILRPSIRKTKILVVLAAIGLFTHGYHVFFSLYRLQSPIVIELRSPVTDKHISPIAEDHGVILLTPTPIQALEEGKKATPSPTPTPKKKAHIIDLVGDVEAAETDQGSLQVTDQEIIDYIKSKDWDDEVAVALAKSENFWNLTRSFDCRRVGAVNKNGSIDRGIFQINSIHDSKISPEDALDCYKNIDYAYSLYQASGWNPWVAYKNGSYLNHL